MGQNNDSQALRALVFDLEQTTRGEEFRADELAQHALDCDRWGLVTEAEDLRRRARGHRVSALLAEAQAASWVMELAYLGRPARQG